MKDAAIQTETERLSIDIYALFTAIEMLANLAANCEFKIYKNGKEEKGRLWELLNYQPNVNQTATEFWREFYKKMLYDGAAMAFETLDNQMIIADGFTISDYEIREKYFSNVYRGTFTSYQTFRMSDVIYISYPLQGIQALKHGLLARYDELISAATSSYKSGSGEKVFLNIPAAASGMANFEDKFKDLMNNRFKSFFKQGNAVLPLFNGMQATFANNSTSASKSTVDDITKLMNDSLARAAQALKMSPILLTGEVAGIKEAVNFTLTAAIDPLMNAVSEQLSVKYFTKDEIVKGSYVVGDTSNINHIDIFDISNAIEKLVGCGYSPDEVRVYAGGQPTGIPAMQEHYITKNFATIEEVMKTGGENE